MKPVNKMGFYTFALKELLHREAWRRQHHDEECVFGKYQQGLGKWSKLRERRLEISIFQIVDWDGGSYSRRMAPNT